MLFNKKSTASTFIQICLNFLSVGNMDSMFPKWWKKRWSYIYFGITIITSGFLVLFFVIGSSTWMKSGRVWFIWSSHHTGTDVFKFQNQNGMWKSMVYLKLKCTKCSGADVFKFPIGLPQVMWATWVEPVWPKWSNNKFKFQNSASELVVFLSSGALLVGNVEDRAWSNDY